jgi:polysaccharide biosynthesis/export protein
MQKFRKSPSSVLAGGLVFLFFYGYGGFVLSAQQREKPQASALPRTQAIEEQQDTQPSAPQRQSGALDDYIIGPEDLLRIDVFQVPDLSGQTVRVANDGTITVPLLGRVKAAGLTTTQLARDLEKEWGKTYLQNPEVTIFVQQFQAKPVSVVGAVERPGLYYMTGPRTLIEVLGMAGGLAKHATDYAGPDLFVTRQGGFGDLDTASGMRLVAPGKVEIQISKLLYSNDPALNISIRPQDIISVSKAGIVYVTGGGVQKPGGFILEDRDEVTALQALAMAQGLTSTAAKRNARIIRQGPNGARVEIPVDMDRVMKGKSSDPVLAANDILFVPDSAQKTALKRAVDVTVSTLSGLLIFGNL